MFPYVVPRAVTIWDAAAPEQSQFFMLVGSVVIIPVILAYSYFTIWPERSAAELAGASRVDVQGQGRGKLGAARSFGWMFEHLGVRLIGLTAALDNVRSARVIEAAGFQAKGERESIRPDGSIRISNYWELARDEWHGSAPT